MLWILDVDQALNLKIFQIILLIWNRYFRGSANKVDLSFKKRGRAIYSPATKVLEEFGENKFSGAILRSYLEHEHEPFEVLKNLKFTLKNDACVIIKVPNYDSVNRKIRKEKWCGFHFLIMLINLLLKPYLKW